MNVVRFQSHVYPEPNTGCWLHDGAPDHAGYPRAAVGGGKVDNASRISWRLYRGDIPTGQFVCHHCDTPSCVNPDHLFLGTHTDNMRDAARKGRLNQRAAKRDSCPHGHPFSPENTLVRKDGGRRCRTCQRRAGARHDGKRRRSSTATSEATDLPSPPTAEEND